MSLLFNNSYLQSSIVLDAYNHLASNLLAVNQKMVELPEGSIVIPLRIETAMLLNQIFFFSDQIYKGAGTIYNHSYTLI